MYYRTSMSTYEFECRKICNCLRVAGGERGRDRDREITCVVNNNAIQMPPSHLFRRRFKESKESNFNMRNEQENNG